MTPQKQPDFDSDTLGDLQLWLMQLWLKDSFSHRCIQLWLKEMGMRGAWEGHERGMRGAWEGHEEGHERDCPQICLYSYFKVADFFQILLYYKRFTSLCCILGACPLNNLRVFQQSRPGLGRPKPERRADCSKDMLRECSIMISPRWRN
eukprot:sb/3473619/